MKHISVLAIYVLILGGLLIGHIFLSWALPWENLLVEFSVFSISVVLLLILFLIRKKAHKIMPHIRFVTMLIIILCVFHLSFPSNARSTWPWIGITRQVKLKQQQKSWNSNEDRFEYRFPIIQKQVIVFPSVEYEKGIYIKYGGGREVEYSQNLELIAID